MILSNRITANKRLENPATHASARIAKVRSVVIPEGEFNAVLTEAPAFFTMLQVVYGAKETRTIDSKQTFKAKLMSELMMIMSQSLAI